MATARAAWMTGGFWVISLARFPITTCMRGPMERSFRSVGCLPLPRHAPKQLPSPSPVTSAAFPTHARTILQYGNFHPYPRQPISTQTDRAATHQALIYCPAPYRLRRKRGQLNGINPTQRVKNQRITQHQGSAPHYGKGIKGQNAATAHGAQACTGSGSCKFPASW